MSGLINNFSNFNVSYNLSSEFIDGLFYISEIDEYFGFYKFY